MGENKQIQKSSLTDEELYSILSDNLVELNEIELFFNGFLQEANVIDESFGTVTSIFNGLTMAVLASMNKSDNEKITRTKAKIALGTFVVGQVAKGVGSFYNYVKALDRANDLLVLKKEKAATWLKSLHRNYDRVLRSENSSRKILTHLASFGYQIDELTSNREVYDVKKNLMQMALEQYRKARFNVISMEFFIAECKAWLKNKHDSDMQQPILQDVNHSIIQEVLFQGDDYEEVIAEFFSGSNEISGSILFVLNDEQLLSHYLSTRKDPLFLSDGVENKYISKQALAVFKDNPALEMSNEFYDERKEIDEDGEKSRKKFWRWIVTGSLLSTIVCFFYLYYFCRYVIAKNDDHNVLIFCGLAIAAFFAFGYLYVEFEEIYKELKNKISKNRENYERCYRYEFALKGGFAKRRKKVEEVVGKSFFDRVGKAISSLFDVGDSDEHSFYYKELIVREYWNPFFITVSAMLIMTIIFTEFNLFFVGCLVVLLFAYLKMRMRKMYFYILIFVVVFCVAFLIFSVADNENRKSSSRDATYTEIYSVPESVDTEVRGGSESVEELYEKGVKYYNEMNYDLAVEYYSKAAELGHAVAQNALGDCFYLGDGVEKDYEQAVRWYIKAAEQGSAIAQLNLGDCYAKGQGVIQDYEKAAEWYRKASGQEYEMANERLNNLGMGSVTGVSVYFLP